MFHTRFSFMELLFLFSRRWKSVAVVYICCLASLVVAHYCMIICIDDLCVSHCLVFVGDCVATLIVNFVIY